MRTFLSVPHLQGVITDSHFARRDRMGRTLAFLARIRQDGWSSEPRSIAVDEGNAVLMEGDGSATVVGATAAYFIKPERTPETCVAKKPLSYSNISVRKVPAGSAFNIAAWSSDQGSGYTLDVRDGVVTSSQAGGGLY